MLSSRNSACRLFATFSPLSGRCCSVYGQVAYHDFEGIAEEADEAPKIFSALGDKFTMIMGNHGLLTIGRTIAEAIANMGRLVRAYETQERLLAANATPAPLSRGICEFTCFPRKRYIFHLLTAAS